MQLYRQLLWNQLESSITSHTRCIALATVFFVVCFGATKRALYLEYENTGYYVTTSLTPFLDYLDTSLDKWWYKKGVDISIRGIDSELRNYYCFAVITVLITIVTHSIFQSGNLSYI